MSLDWSKFTTLSGAKTNNFEKLCRGIVSRHFGNHGALKGIKNQPGVEYYLELKSDDSRLGNTGEIIGWQCKYFEYRQDGKLTANAKSQISDSLDKTKTHLPECNVWILWTHKNLAKPDQDWFYELEKKYDFELKLWNNDDLENYLSGPAHDLRDTYFGELALTTDMLSDQHTHSVAPIKSRWIPNVHITTDTEHTIRQVLGEAIAFKAYEETLKSLTQIINEINAIVNEPEYAPLIDEIAAFLDVCVQNQEYCSLFNRPISRTDFEQIEEFHDRVFSYSFKGIYIVQQHLRRQNLRLSLYITNAIAYIKDVRKLLTETIDLLSQQLVAVIADAGGGKTQLAAQLTSETKDRPAGILILGRNLHKTGDLNSLVQKIQFYNKPLESFEMLVAALDATATRAGVRLPIVIDGLNEAQDPREWKDLLCCAQEILIKYKNVVLICTLRTSESKRHSDHQRIHFNANSRESLAKSSLPDDCYLIHGEEFGHRQTIEAIQAYFAYYKIEANFYAAHLSFFSHPLNLRIFCDVKNRERENVVKIDHFPSSIYSLFDELVAYSAQNIAGMTFLSKRYKNTDIHKAIFILGKLIWEANTRHVQEDRFKSEVGAQEIDWESDIVNLLAQEGFIFRDEEEAYTFYLTPVYDRLGGYLVANYLLRSNAKSTPETWLQEESLLNKIFGEMKDRHELEYDILCALVALMPKLTNKQLWVCVPGEYKSIVVNYSHFIDIEDICQETAEAYKNNIIDGGLTAEDFRKLEKTKMVPSHPFNADFFSKLILELSMPSRDLTWTEYIRIRHRDFLQAIIYRKNRWKSEEFDNKEVDRLRAVNLSWFLTSTCIELRDIATEALFYYGLKYPKNLLDITLGLINVNDLYVSERLLAASYGVIATLINRGEKHQFFVPFAKIIHNRIFSLSAENATTHMLARNYASCIIKTISEEFPDRFTSEEIASSLPPFPAMPRRYWHPGSDSYKERRSDSPFRMDFENYTIGDLVPDRGNYDYEHQEYVDIRNKIEKRIYNLGWTPEDFAEVDRRIDSDKWSSRLERSRIERYGKKYSWIAYYEMAGQLEDLNKLDKWADKFAADIDPFFPQISDHLPKVSKLYIGGTFSDTADWVSSENPDFKNLYKLDKIYEIDGPWALIDGHISEESSILNRDFYASISTLMLNENNRKELLQSGYNSIKARWPQKQSTHYLFSGEIYRGDNWLKETEHGISIPIGHESKEIVLPKRVANDKVLSEGGKEQFTHPLYKEFDVKLPMINYYWEYSHSNKTSVNEYLLAPFIVEALKLHFDPNLLQYKDVKGNIAMVVIKEKEQEYSDYQDFVYLRKDLLDELLSKLNLRLVYKIYIERRPAELDDIDRSDYAKLSKRDILLKDYS